MIRTVELLNFKKFPKFTLRLQGGNILVGPNNSGKSSILDAFRILEACMRHAKTRNPKLLDIKGHGVFDGYELSESLLPFRIANATHNYDDDDAVLEFQLEDKTKAIIRIHQDRQTRFYIDRNGARFTTSTKFRNAFPVDIVIVPTLAPLEADEPCVADATVAKNRRNRLASRVLRNIWLREPDEDWEDFRKEVENAWPTVALKKPELVRSAPPIVEMFFSEQRIDREVQWAGFGFQAWLQIQTHLRRGSSGAILVIDEPDIYLHPDLQRRLLRRIRDRFPQFIMATHSIEIINDADAKEIISINPEFKTGKRINTEEEFDAVYRYIGSCANADLARISRARRVIFVEGKDGRLLRRLGARMGFLHLAESASVPIVQLGGFSRWKRADDAAWAFKSVLGLDVKIFCLFDRDYRCDEEITRFLEDTTTSGLSCIVLGRKEIENYLLDPAAVHRALVRRVKARDDFTGTEPSLDIVKDLFGSICTQLELDVKSQRTAHATRFAEESGSRLDRSTLIKSAMEKFDEQWRDSGRKLTLVPGKEFLSLFNTRVQASYSVSLTELMIVDSLSVESMDSEFRDTLRSLDEFCAA